MPNAILAANGENRNILAAHFEAWSIFATGVDFAEEGNFRSSFRSCEMGIRALQSGTHVPKGGFEAAKSKNSSFGIARSSSNDHNFFVSNPNHAPFEAMDS